MNPERPRSSWMTLVIDGMTLARLLIAGGILALGWRAGREAFPAAILLATLGWMTDAVDGFFARHCHCPTRLGRVDFAVDVALTWSEFLFIALAGMIPMGWVAGYTLLAALISGYFHRKAVLVLFMRGIDGLLLYMALRYAAVYTLPLLGWLVILGWLQRDRVRKDVSRWWRELKATFHISKK